jgi:putative copper export protein
VIELLLAPLQRGLLFAGVLVLVGMPVWRSFIEPRLRDSFGREAEGGVAALEVRMAKAGLFLSMGLLPVWALRLYVQLLNFRDPFVPVSEDLHFLVLETFWGLIWIVQGVLFLALAGLFAALGRNLLGKVASSPGPASRPVTLGADRFPVRWLAVWVVVILLVLTLSFSGHAMSYSTLALAADSVHILAAGTWIGLLALILMLLPSGPSRRSFLSLQLRSFSPLAMVAVGVLVSMGIFLTWTYLNEISDLWATPYGRVLIAKVGLAGVALVLGFINWRRGLPSLDSDQGARIVFRRAALEVGTVGAVVVMTAILVGRSLP